MPLHRPGRITLWITGGAPLAACRIALLSFIAGLVTVPMVLCLPPVGGITGVVAVVLGLLALRLTPAGRTGPDGSANLRALAIIGLCCGALGLLAELPLLLISTTTTVD